MVFGNAHEINRIMIPTNRFVFSVVVTNFCSMLSIMCVRVAVLQVNTHHFNIGVSLADQLIQHYSDFVYVLVILIYFSINVSQNYH